MITTVYCKNCHAFSTPLDAVTVDVTLQKTKWCGHCYGQQNQKYNLYFCSPKCMLIWLQEHARDFLKDVAKLRAERMWDHTFDPEPDSGENAPVKWKEPEAFFTDPKPSTMMDEAKELIEKEEVCCNYTQEQIDEILDRNLCCATHCCTKHGCKYGLADCPVVLGFSPSNDCEQCGLEREGYYNDEILHDDSD